jgi:hypothetical protein
MIGIDYHMMRRDVTMQFLCGRNRIESRFGRRS